MTTRLLKVFAAKPWFRDVSAFVAGIVATHMVKSRSHASVNSLHDRAVLALPGQRRPLVVPLIVYDQLVLQANEKASPVRVANQGPQEKSMIDCIKNRQAQATPGTSFSQ